MPNGSTPPRHPSLPSPAYSAASFSLPTAFDHPAIVRFVERADYGAAHDLPASYTLLNEEESSDVRSARLYAELSSLLNALYSALRSQPSATSG